jgi:hypothetical protein
MQSVLPLENFFDHWRFFESGKKENEAVLKTGFFVIFFEIA